MNAALVLESEECTNVWASDIGIKHEHVTPALSKRYGKIDGNRRPSGAAIGAGNRDDCRRSARVAQGSRLTARSASSSRTRPAEWLPTMHITMPRSRPQIGSLRIPIFYSYRFLCCLFGPRFQSAQRCHAPPGRWTHTPYCCNCPRPL